MDDVCELSLILPAFNEEAGIAAAIAEADAALSRLGLTYEIIVVDDGSTDRTAEIAASVGVRVIRHEVNLGYGAALRNGFAAARGNLIAFTDADCQFYLDDLTLLIPHVQLVDGSFREPNPLAERAVHHQPAHLAIGYRVDRQDSLLRKFYSRGYNLLSRVLLGACARDIDCALKVFRRDVLEKLMPETDGFFVNTEMLTKARQQNLTIAEVGVRHRPRARGDSKVGIGAIPRVLGAMLPFWWRSVMFPGPTLVVDSLRESAFDSVNRCKSSSPEDGVKLALAERVYHHVPARLQAVLMLILFAITCVLFFARLDHPLLEPEEARYAEIPRQMLAEGRFLTPVLHGEDYWQKPPLLYWLVMLSYQTFGVYDWAARLVPGVAGILSVIIVTLWGLRTLGFWTGFVSGAILSLSARFLYLAGMLSMDGLLCTCVLGGLAAGQLALTEERRRVRWSLLMCLAVALGILTKGPVALVLIVAPLGMLAFLDRRCQFWSVLESCVYFGVVALFAGPWFVLMAISAPEAAGTFFWLHHLLRYVAPIDHEKPAWFYVPSLALGMLPWTLLLVPAIPYLWKKSLRAGRRRPAPLGAFVLAFAWCVVFFSLSGCKRQGYILPAFPLLALILGTFVTHGLPWRLWMASAAHIAERSGHRWARGLTFAACAMGVTCAAAAALAQLWSWQHGAILAAAFALLTAIITIPISRLPAWTSWVGCVAIMFFFLFIGQRTLLPEYHDRFGLRRQVEITSEYEQDAELPIFTYPKRWDSVSFYAQRKNVESYTPQERDKLIRDLQTHGKAIVFLRRDSSLQELLKALPKELEIEFLGRNSDYVAVGLVKSRLK